MDWKERNGGDAGKPAHQAKIIVMDAVIFSTHCTVLTLTVKWFPIAFYSLSFPPCLRLKSPPKKCI